MKRYLALALWLGACGGDDGMTGDDGCELVTWLADADGDGFGAEYSGCEAPAAVALVGGDCHDDDADAYPHSRVRETPFDGVDQDCDGNDVCTDLNCDGRADLVLPSYFDGDTITLQPAYVRSGEEGWTLDPTPIAQSGTLGTAVADLNHDGYPDLVEASNSGSTGPSTDSFIYWGPDHLQAQRTGLPSLGAVWPCIADLDGNGYDDILITNNFTGTTNTTSSYIYWNRSTGFSPSDRTELPTTAAHLCSIVDLENDGFLDIVISGYFNGAPGAAGYMNNLVVFHGNASHTYSVANRTALPTVGSTSHDAVDLDGDGRLDLVAYAHYNGTSYKSSANYVYFNSGEGFSPARRRELEGYGAQRGAVADLNGDGQLDIVIPGHFMGAWTTPSTSYIYWGDAEQAYTSRTALDTTASLTVLVEDVNSDGHVDLVFPGVFDGESLADTIVFYADPDVSTRFSGQHMTRLPGYQPAWGTRVLDFDHDGFKDVFIPGYHNNITGSDPAPWTNMAESRIYWGSETGLDATRFSGWPSRGAWNALVVGQ